MMLYTIAMLYLPFFPFLFDCGMTTSSTNSLVSYLEFFSFFPRPTFPPASLSSSSNRSLSFSFELFPFFPFDFPSSTECRFSASASILFLAITKSVSNPGNPRR